jgi:phospholipid/cholesterol/gamma-HCH transport system substrate-binding protein
MQDIEEGKGTLGRLAKDEQLYENLNEVSSEVVKLLYDFRQNPKKFLTIKFELF